MVGVGMAVPQVEEVAVDALLSSDNLSVDGKFAWKQSNEKSWYKIVIPVKCEAKKVISLRIVVSVSSFNREYRTFALLWNNNIRVRALCMLGNHGNKHSNAETWIRRTHKHKWTDDCQDRFAYTPNDITETSVQGQLSQFCEECGIRSTATVADLPGHGIYYDDL
jgi:hypothetical protein